MSGLTQEQVTALLGKAAKPVRKGKLVTKVKEYYTDYERASEETYPCEVCGNCPWPEKCVASVVCPFCGSTESNLCQTPTGGLTGYHEQRWQTVKDLYGTYYK